MTGSRLACGLVLGVMLAGTAQASEPLRLTDAKFHQVASMEHAAEGRPNEEARLAALRAHLQGEHATAVAHFRRAAYYADKYSQHALSLLYWHGVGTPADRVQAYVWADLAAERGRRQLLLVRERMWQELTAAERKEAQSVGPAYYARYGDEVAQPRAESIMRRFARNMTGSRVGFDGQMLEIAGRPSGGQFAPQMGGSASAYMGSAAATRDELYGETRNNFAAYWDDQDQLLDGHVEVGPVANANEGGR